MPESQPVAKRNSEEDLLVLGVDTCGSSGTVALARIQREKTAILGQKELAGRTYSATLVATIAEILEKSGLKLTNLTAIVVVNGPGSFTGVRVGLSAVKGLAEPGQIPVVAVSRLEVMAAKVRLGSAALDAHRSEVFLRIAARSGVRELLAGAEELAELRQAAGIASQVSGSRAGAPAILIPEEPIVICEDAAESVLSQAWPEAKLLTTGLPSAADAIELCVPRILARDFVDLALLDGHYLRRSDAEIFGDRPRKTADPGCAIHVRRMRPTDVDAVTEMAKLTHHAPTWTREAYEKAVDPSGRPRRVAVVAEDAKSGRIVGYAVASLITSEAELETIVTAVAHQRRGVARKLFSSLKNELLHMGVQEIVLEVRAGNKAAGAFYRFLGFVEQGHRPSYYADPVEDAVLMRLEIRSTAA